MINLLLKAYVFEYFFRNKLKTQFFNNKNKVLKKSKITFVLFVDLLHTELQAIENYFVDDKSLKIFNLK